MRHKYYGQIIFCGAVMKTNSGLVPRLQSRLESGGFRKLPGNTPGPNGDPIGLDLEGIVPISVWSSNLQAYVDRDGDVARLTCGRVRTNGATYLELEFLPGGPKGGFDEKLEGLPLALELRKDILKELADSNTNDPSFNTSSPPRP